MDHLDPLAKTAAVKNCMSLTFVNLRGKLQRVREEVLRSLQADYVDGHHWVVGVQLHKKIYFITY